MDAKLAALGGMRCARLKVFSSRAAIFLALAAAPARAEPEPVSLDRALQTTLRLGQADGCSNSFGFPILGQQELDEELRRLRDNDQLGDELAAVCGSSAVTSAAALGGSLGSPQTTKTVSQFRLARRRVDSRLDLRGKRFGLSAPLILAALEQPPRATDAVRAGDVAPERGFGVFAQGEHEQRERATTLLEAGYDARISEGLLGVDYVTERGLIAGAWVGYRNTGADYARANLLVGSLQGNDTSGLAGSLSAALIADICKIGPGGKFDDDGVKFGGFVGARFGGGFADLALQYSKRDYEYRRNVCAIETLEGDAIVPNADSPSGFSSGGTDIDDVYAGTLSGETELTEWSIAGRAGYDFGNERLLWGPRVSLTYVKSKIDAFTETGRTSVTHPVESNSTDDNTGLPTLRTERAAGNPTGLELAFDEQRRSSLQSELQLVAAYRFEPAFGAIIPRASLSWIHEFKGERERVNVRMAQDLRATPTRFSFTTDSADKDKGVIALGVTALRGVRFAADVEIAHLIADEKFDSTSVTAQARWRF